MPPAKPPLPTARKREFHSCGRKRPKLKADVGEEVTFIWTAQRAGRPAGEVRYAISPAETSKVELEGRERV